jgi:hypothetical protein
MTIDYDTRASVSPQPPQDGRWAIFVPAGYKKMTLGEAELTVRGKAHCSAFERTTSESTVLFYLVAMHI